MNKLFYSTPLMDRQKGNLSELISDDLLSQCIHCGICLSVCPTYDITKLERSSPRGRIRLIKAFANNETSLGKLFEDEMSFCLGCRACETACPAGVNYGALHQSTKNILNSKKRFSLKKMTLKFFLNFVLSSNSRLKFFSKILYFYQNSYLRKFILKREILKKLFPKFVSLDELSPEISLKFSDELIARTTLSGISPKYNTAFHYGCIMNVAFSDVNIDTVELLTKSGCRVETPKNQNCCGALHAHNGELNTAKKLAKSNIDLFESFGYEYLISNSAGCGAFMKEYSHLLIDDKVYSEKAKIFSAKVKDITEFLVENKILLSFKESNDSVTYHDACHHVHGQGVFNQPRTLLNKISRIKYTEMKESTWCCGSAGIYNLLRFEDSMKFLSRKMSNIYQTGADIVLTGNPGCILQLKHGAKKSVNNIVVKHLVSYLNEMTDV